jgi:CRP/FNR family transcriptional regulator
MLSKELGNASLLAADHSADERVAAFLVDLANRFEARGFSGTRLHLSMSRSDIANYLRLAADTVSRVLGRFRTQKLIRSEGRELELLDPEGLRQVGLALLGD